MSPQPQERPEERESLWVLAGGPLAWAAHFLLSYGTASIWHAKLAPEDGSLGPVHAVLATYTAIALAVIAWAGWRGWRRHSLGSSRRPHAADTDADRHRFLGYASLLLAGLSAVAVIYAQLAVVLTGSGR